MAVLSSRLRRPAPPLPPVPVRKAIVAAASAIPLDGSGWKNFKLGDSEWQVEGWKHYDICGELRFVANWAGASVSRCRIYIAEVDDTGKPGDEVEDPAIAMLAETVFGGPAKKAEALRLLGTHLYVPGESYIVAEGVSNASEDRWYVVSTSGIRRQGDRDIQVERPQEYGGGWYTLKQGQDLLIRVWTPHPRKYDVADSSVRPALPILREIEQLTKHIFAQIDSRLAGAGLLLLPDQLDFPRGEDDPAGAEGLMKVLQRAMAAALADRADPSSLVPIMAQVPGEFIDKVRHITFETPLAAQGMEIRDRAIRRLGLSLDVDPETLLGKGDTNHWSAWQVEESGIKIHIEPLLARICDALTTGYLRAALTVLGKDPDQYTFWYDTSPLAVRPNRQADGLELFNEDALSEDALRTAGAWSEDDAPSDEERARRLATKLVLAQPDLIREKAIREALGVQWDLEPAQAPPALGEAPAGAQAPAQAPAGAPAQAPTRARADAPARTGARTPAPARERALPQAPAGARTPAQAALLMGAHMVVRRSLEMAGKRLLTRANRDKYRSVAPWELHTHIHVLDADHATRLLDDTFDAVGMLAERTGVPGGLLRDLLAAYCRELMVKATPHREEWLETVLEHGLHAECATGDDCRFPDHRGQFVCQEPAGQFHLPGRHDQRNHGRRGDRPGFKPFTPAQRRERATERREGVDPDAAAPAPARQGRRAFREWEREASVLTGRANREVRDKQAEILQRPEPKGGEDAKQAEWAQREKEMRDELAVTVARLYVGLTDAGDPDRDVMVNSVKEMGEKRITEARNLFFGEDPEVLTGGDVGELPWFHQLRKETPWDAPVPVRNMRTQSGHRVEHGYAWHRDGVTYMVETPEGADPGHARQVAQMLAGMHADRLPAGAAKYQKGYLWTSSASPDDAYWQKRFKNPNHWAAASAGDGSVTFWRKPYGKLPGALEEGHIVHEFGHNLDETSKTGGRISKSDAYRAAAKVDFDANQREANVRDFISRDVRHQFPVTLKEGFGKEAPYGPTPYGQSSWAEDLAESLRLYQQGVIGDGHIVGWGEEFRRPVYFRDLFPARAKILDAEFPELAKEQKAKIKAERGPRPRRTAKAAAGRTP